MRHKVENGEILQRYYSVINKQINLEFLIDFSLFNLRPAMCPSGLYPILIYATTTLPWQQDSLLWKITVYQKLQTNNVISHIILT